MRKKVENIDIRRIRQKSLGRSGQYIDRVPKEPREKSVLRRQRSNKSNAINKS